MVSTSLRGKLWVLYLVMLTRLFYSYADPVTLTVFYESYCPGSREFLVDQVGPTYKLIPQAMNVVLVPFGDASYQLVDWKNTLVCQHGPRECRGNAIQACAVTLYNSSQAIPFVVCCSDLSGDPVDSAEKCAETNGMDWNKLNDCSTSEVGQKIIDRMKAATRASKLQSMPWILINNVRLLSGDREARTNLLKTICDRVNPKPSNCPQND